MDSTGVGCPRGGGVNGHRAAQTTRAQDGVKTKSVISQRCIQKLKWKLEGVRRVSQRPGQDRDRLKGGRRRVASAASPDVPLARHLMHIQKRRVFFWEAGNLSWPAEGSLAKANLQRFL